MKAGHFWRRKIVLAALIAGALLTGCSDEGKINAPFTYSGCKGKNVTEITAQLEEAGFTNIQTEPQDTTTESHADNVISVKIGSKTTWNEANVWKPDTAVTVKYYNYTGIRHITVTVDTAVSGEDGKPVFTINTNLPDGTVLNTELAYDGALTAGREDYDETQDVIVQDGTAQTEAYTRDGEALTGDYQFYVLMLPAEQSEDVQEMTGSSGEALKGDLVQKEGSYRFIQTKTAYQSPVEEPTPEIEKVSEEELENRIRAALAGFDDSCNISVEGYLYTVQIWRDGVAPEAMLAKLGNTAAAEQWKELEESTKKASLNLQYLLYESGYSDYLIQLQLLNDQNLDNTLLTACMGAITYNCMDD